MLSIDIRAIAPTPAHPHAHRAAPSRLLPQSHARLLGDDPGLRPGLPPLPRRGRLHRRIPRSSPTPRAWRCSSRSPPSTPSRTSFSPVAIHCSAPTSTRSSTRPAASASPSPSLPPPPPTSPLRFSPSSSTPASTRSASRSTAPPPPATKPFAESQAAISGPSTPSATPPSSASPSRSTPSSPRRPPTTCPPSTSSSRQYKIMRWSLFYLIAVGRGKELQPVTPRARRRADALDLRPHPRSAVRHQDHRGALLSPRRPERHARGRPYRQPRSSAPPSTAASASATATASSSSPTRATFIPPASCRSPAETSASITWSASTATRRSSGHSTLPACSAASAAQCEYRTLCGGSRARAFAYTGDPLASDPFCAYEPRTSAGDHTAREAAQSILAGAY